MYFLIEHVILNIIFMQIFVLYLTEKGVYKNLTINLDHLIFMLSLIVFNRFLDERSIKPHFSIHQIRFIYRESV